MGGEASSGRTSQGLPTGRSDPAVTVAEPTRPPGGRQDGLFLIHRTSVVLGTRLHRSLSFYFDHRNGKETKVAFAATFPCFALVRDGCVTRFRVVARDTLGSVILDTTRQQGNHSMVLVPLATEFPQLAQTVGSVDLLPLDGPGSLLNIDAVPLQFDPSGLVTALPAYGN